MLNLELKLSLNKGALTKHFSDFWGKSQHSILVWGGGGHFSVKNLSLRWGILIGKQKHNVQHASLALFMAYIW